MVEIVKSGVTVSHPVRKFKCFACRCKYKTDEYEYINDILGRGMYARARCPECDRASDICV